MRKASARTKNGIPEKGMEWHITIVVNGVSNTYTTENNINWFTSLLREVFPTMETVERWQELVKSLE